MQVFLSENVFLGLVLSAVEVYKKECFGLLLGYRTPEKYIVDHAIPYQSVKRGYNWAELRMERWQLMKEVLKNFPKLDVIGDFHSHTMYRGDPASIDLTPDDIEYMEPTDLQVVVAVNESKRSKSWAVNFDHTVSGTIDRFHFKIAAYFFANGEKPNGHPSNGPTGAKGVLVAARARPRLAEIVSPFALATR